jgi:hypothetical protein
MYEKMLNSIFDFGLKRSLNIMNKEIKKEASNNPIKVNIFSSKKALDISKSNNTIKNKNDLIKLLNTKLYANNDQRKHIKLGTFKLLRMYLCQCTKKLKEKFNTVKFALRKLTKYLDYLKISNTLQEYNRLKKVLFTKAQRKMLSISSKPKILLEKSENNIKVIENDDEKITSLFNHYSEIRENKNYPINQKLLNFMNILYKSVFEELI